MEYPKVSMALQIDILFNSDNLTSLKILMFLLNVHLSIILVINQLNAQILVL